MRHCGFEAAPAAPSVSCWNARSASRAAQPASSPLLLASEDSLLLVHAVSRRRASKRGGGSQWSSDWKIAAWVPTAHHHCRSRSPAHRPRELLLLQRLPCLRKGESCRKMFCELQSPSLFTVTDTTRRLHPFLCVAAQGSPRGFRNANDTGRVRSSLGGEAAASNVEKISIRSLSHDERGVALLTRPPVVCCTCKAPCGAYSDDTLK